MKREPKTHDYTLPVWGHAVEVISIKGEDASVVGFGHDVKPGDLLLLPNGAHTTQYQVETIEYKRPADCWTANIKFKPRGPAA